MLSHRKAHWRWVSHIWLWGRISFGTIPFFGEATENRVSMLGFYQFFEWTLSPLVDCFTHLAQFALAQLQPSKFLHAGLFEFRLWLSDQFFDLLMKQFYRFRLCDALKCDTFAAFVGQKWQGSTFGESLTQIGAWAFLRKDDRLRDREWIGAWRITVRIWLNTGKILVIWQWVGLLTV